MQAVADTKPGVHKHYFGPDYYRKQDYCVSTRRNISVSPGWPAPEERSVPMDAGHDTNLVEGR